MDKAIKRIQIRITGIVQGVGFRPFVYNTAAAHGVNGWVMNDSSGVVIQAEGTEDAIGLLLKAVKSNPPPLAHIDNIHIETLAALGEKGFGIKDTGYTPNKDTLISPDVATCKDCVEELFDPGNRRYRYPFINCINCGPRFSITTDIPYDRVNTTMAEFEMCDECRQEYEDKSNRRFHAQPIACSKCGPSLVLYDLAAERELETGDIYAATAKALYQDKIVAIKGIGGYHLCLSAVSEKACAELRKRKHRYAKPLAMMVKSIEEVRKICDFSEEEEAALLLPERPIILLRKKENSAVQIAAGVAYGSKYLGVMLPYTPIHHLLFAEIDIPLVMTSGNLSDEPIAYKDDDAMKRLASIADIALTHDRAIAIRIDDSVAHIVGNKPYFIRRSRGFAPRPITLPFQVPKDMLACGAELKNTFCLAKGEYAFLSHHIGDLENYKTYVNFTESIEYYEYIFDVRPKVIVHDLHPEYLSTKYAYDRAGFYPDVFRPFPDGIKEYSYMQEITPEKKGDFLFGVQHHHSHVASCMLDNGHLGRTIGIAFDGSGYGEDGTLWGSEVITADLKSFQRVASLRPIPLLGGVQAIKEPWRIAAYYIYNIFGKNNASYNVSNLEVYINNQKDWHNVLSLVDNHYKNIMTTSMGRLFDAVGALLCQVYRIGYEGQAAVELESLIDLAEEGSYSLPDISDLPIILDGSSLFECVLGDVFLKCDPHKIATRFHNTIQEFILNVCVYIREQYGLGTVALSGGVFQNRYLLDHTISELNKNDFKVLINRNIPTNDAGISFGQIAIAAQSLAL